MGIKSTDVEELQVMSKIKWIIVWSQTRTEKKEKYSLKLFHPHIAVDKELGKVMVASHWKLLADEANI